MARRTSSRRGTIGHPASRTILFRQVHAYLSVFVAPTVLLFAFTGILQLYGLHEAHAGYRPPALIEKLGRLHKEQTYSLRPTQREAPSGEGDWVKPATKAPPTKAPDLKTPDLKTPDLKTRVLKALFCAAAVMLIVSALLGVWMAVTQNRRKIVLLVVFLLGAATPVAILLL